MTRSLAAGCFAFGIEQFGEAGIFLEKCKIFIIARVVAVFRAQLDRCFQILHRGFGFPGKTIQSGHGVKNKIGFGAILRARSR